MLFEEHREEVAYFMRRLYEQKLTTTSGGNISLKIDDEHILITPSQSDKARLTAEQIGIIGSDGTNKTPGLKLSMETGMHLSIYRKRKDVRAIIHAHPVFGSSFAVMDKEVNCRLMGESRAVIGSPVVAPYALMGTENLAEIVSMTVQKSNVVLLKNHGVLTVGENLLQAFDRVEVLEVAAKVTLITTLMNDCNEISEEDIKDIDQLFNQ